jgi:hypothetical protein
MLHHMPKFRRGHSSSSSQGIQPPQTTNTAAAATTTSTPNIILPSMTGSSNNNNNNNSSSNLSTSNSNNNTTMISNKLQHRDSNQVIPTPAVAEFNIQLQQRQQQIQNRNNMHHHHQQQQLPISSITEEKNSPTTSSHGKVTVSEVSTDAIGFTDDVFPNQISTIATTNNTNNNPSSTAATVASTTTATNSGTITAQHQHQQQQQRGTWPKLPPPKKNMDENTKEFAVIDSDSEKTIDRALTFVESLMQSTAHPSDEITYAFTGQRVPKISIRAYLIRIVKYVNRYAQEAENVFSSDCSGFISLLGGLVLLERLTKIGRLELNDWTVHRALIATVLVAHKVLDDDNASNNFFSRIGGISLGEMNALELTVCKALRFEFRLTESFPRLKRKFGSSDDGDDDDGYDDDGGGDGQPIQSSPPPPHDNNNNNPTPILHHHYPSNNVEHDGG